MTIDQVLEDFENKRKRGVTHWAKSRAREGVQRAPAELAQARDAIFWRDEELPFSMWETINEHLRIWRCPNPQS
jgi:hypothetical protein